MTATPALPLEAELEWEARRGPLAAGAAFLSAVLIFGSVLIQITQIGAPDNDRETLRLLHDHQGDFMVSLGLQVASYVLLVVALFYLLRATIYRRPETPKFSLALLVLAPILLAVGAVLNQLALNDVADQFVSSVGNRSNHAANEFAKDLIKDRDKLGGYLAQVGTLCLAITFVLVSINSMRAGLLSRFMGVLGVIVGGLLILPLLPGGQSVVQLFWLLALGVLFLGRWPGGRGPAWDSGEAVPWPSAAELRDELETEAAPVEQRQAESVEPEPPEPRESEAEPAQAAPEASMDQPRPASRKRKRKKRR